MSKSSHVTYKHAGTGRVVTYSKPHPSLEKAEGWQRGEDPKPATVDEILAEVGDDAEKAAEAPEAERAGKNRSSLVSKLEAIAAASS